MPLSGMIISTAPQLFPELPRAVLAAAASKAGEGFAPPFHPILSLPWAVEWARGSAPAPMALLQTELLGARGDGVVALGSAPTGRKVEQESAQFPLLGLASAPPFDGPVWGPEGGHDSAAAPRNRAAENGAAAREIDPGAEPAERGGDSLELALDGDGCDDRAAEPGMVDPPIARRHDFGAAGGAGEIGAPLQAKSESENFDSAPDIAIGKGGAAAQAIMGSPGGREIGIHGASAAEGAPVDSEENNALPNEETAGALRQAVVTVRRQDAPADIAKVAYRREVDQGSSAAPASRATETGGRALRDAAETALLSSEATAEELPSAIAAPSSAPPGAAGRAEKQHKTWATEAVSRGGSHGAEGARAQTTDGAVNRHGETNFMTSSKGEVVVAPEEAGADKGGGAEPPSDGSNEAGDSAAERPTPVGRGVEDAALGAPATARTAELRPRETPVTVRPSWSDQAAGDIVRHLRIGSREAVLRLDPPELGNVRIELRLEDGKLHARLLADRAEAQDLIQDHLPELRQALLAHRIDLAELRIGPGEWKGGGDLAQGFHQPSQEQRETGRGFESPAEARPRGRDNKARSSGPQEGRVSLWA